MRPGQEFEETSEGEVQPPVRKKPAAASAHRAEKLEDSEEEELEEPEQEAEEEDIQPPVCKKPAAASAHVAEADAEAEAEKAAELPDLVAEADDSQNTWDLPGLRSPESPEAVAVDHAPVHPIRSPEERLNMERALCLNAMAAVPVAELAALGPGVEPVLRQDSPEHGQLRTYMGPDKAYIQYQADNKIWRSISNFAKTASASAHKQHCLAVWHQLRKPGFNSTKAEELKQLLQRHRIRRGLAGDIVEGEDVN